MQVWLVILMIGTLLGSIVQVGHFILAVSHLLPVAEADLSGGIQFRQTQATPLPASMLQNSECLAASKKPSFAQVGEVCASGITFINANYNGVLVHGSGRIIMILGVILMSAFVFLRNLRQLEIAGDFGFIVVLVMVIVIMVSNTAYNMQQDKPSNFLEGYLRTLVIITADSQK